MEQWEDLYGVLQVHSQAELDIIQGAYRRLCRKYHPDVNSSLTAQKNMQRINRAYEVLSNPITRREYHAQWTRRASRYSPPTAERAEVRERIVYVHTPPREPSHGGTPAAAKVLREYFDCLSVKNYEKAYSLVSLADKKFFGYGAFMEWRESVSAIYEVSTIKSLRLFKNYSALETNAGDKVAAEEFAVTLIEKNKNTNTVKECSMTKYTVLEDGAWSIYLGYRDLTPLKMQFKVAASNPMEAQYISFWDKHKEAHCLEMGMPNRTGLDDCIEREACRHKLYGRPFTLGVFSITMPDKIGADQAMSDQVLKYAGYIISHAVRIIDSAAWLGDNLFAVLLAEMERREAGAAIRRILKAVRHDVAACFDFEVLITAGLTEYGGNTTDELIGGCLKTIQAAAAAEQDRIQVFLDENEGYI
ncbi:MAG: DnaJ domain-containing protein [Oscillospiraceae bacterium]|nr:DnaJ domain-containing protein [Oscillospiraceae bacterium]